MTSRHRTTSNQRWNNVVYNNVQIYNVEQRWNNDVFFNVELSNVRQCRNNVVIFNVYFHNVGKRRNNVANMTIWKKYKPRFKNKIIFSNFKEYVGLNIFLHFFPILREICKRTFAEPQKILKHWIYWITKSIIKLSHFEKCQLVFNFKRQVQAHFYYRSFYFYVSLKCVRKL